MAEQVAAHADVLRRLVGQLFPKAAAVSVRPASPGRTVVVYRVQVGDQTFYLRLAERRGQDLTTDALVLERLRSLGVRVPEVVHVSPPAREISRSWLLMTEIAGSALARHWTDEEATQVAAAAGRDLAAINSVTVAGYGWIRRDGSQHLTAELPSYSEFATSYLPVPWPGPLGQLFTEPQLDALCAHAAGEQARSLQVGCLVHGDLDVTHVYASRGRYSGIIDFGEIRGADSCFDLGHFLLHDGETRSVQLFRSLLAGYSQTGALPTDCHQAIRTSAILSGLRQLSRWLSPERGLSPDQPLVRLRVAELSNLLRDRPAHHDLPAGSAPSLSGRTRARRTTRSYLRGQGA
jgi:aminoglycoside phosphotransferase (APT) family kinase protein